MSHRPANKAKPNTRFLGRIIKETTNHNAALLAREAAEAQARLNNLTEAEEKKRRKVNPSASDLRRRQLGDISSILQGRKKPNGAERDEGRRQKDEMRDKEETRDRSRDRDHRRSRHSTRQGDKEEGQRSRRKHDDRTRDEYHRRRDRSRSPRQKARKHRDRSPLSSSDEDSRLRHSKSRRGKSGKDRDLMAGESSRRKSYGRLLQEDDEFTTTSKTSGLAEGDESDPLEELIGPVPPSEAPVRTRGRGAIRGAAAMDGRFSEDYDPASDVQPEEPTATEDWDEAVETFRDLQKWKQQGADRLRAAGFTEEQVKQWEKGGEKDIDDVRWSKAGEKREWDRGKEVNGA
ncbi:hypothetical protein F5144DRAFT_320347 [Chaetomium tenue]|uniref:Uncharacterized protein n=1 Tax=Chaetomium tenue TaxID=1854479 RepID=A0ACB7P9N9_9PEZI|nr:hypothetical protein F5144DRAFT_320347 [Chaetomium globosum]